MNLSSPIAIDTETVNGDIWCLSYSCTPGTGYVIMKNDHNRLDELRKHVLDPEVLSIFHNLEFDLPVLESVNLRPANYTDTLKMAYLLQDIPLGLKNLAYRICGMDLTDYNDVTREASEIAAMGYLIEILDREWPDPDPIIEWRGKERKMVSPTNIKKKVNRILNDMEKCNENDPRGRWARIKSHTGRALVETNLGSMPLGQISEVPFEKAVRYAAQDADATLRVYHKLWPRIQAEGLEEVLSLEVAIIPMVLRMMEKGVQIDRDQFTKIGREHEIMIAKQEAKIWEMVGEEFNIGSDQQVADLLYNKLHLKKGRYTSGGKPSTADDQLIRLLGTHPVVGEIRRDRELKIRKNTFIDPLPRKADADDRIHPTIRSTRVVSGRLSYASPNLQNIPGGSKESLGVRNGFIARPGCALVRRDYGGLHLRICADFTMDPLMVETFINDGDLHTITAAQIFGKSIGDVTKAERKAAKIVNFAILYDASAETILLQLWGEGLDHWTLEEVEDVLIKGWYDAFPGVMETYEEKIPEIIADAKVVDMFGRMRLVPEVRSAHDYVKRAGLRQGFNHFFLGAEQGIMKKAMVELTEEYVKWNDHARFHCVPWLQMHDELVFEVHETIADRWMEIMKEKMEGVIDLVVPLKTDGSFGYRWGECNYGSMRELRKSRFAA